MAAGPIRGSPAFWRGCILCLTIIGIPLGVGSFKMAGAALAPFGKQIVRKKDLRYVPPAPAAPAI